MSESSLPVGHSKIQKRQVLADHVFEAVLALLLDGEVETGSSLSIDGLARRFDVSSTPVREALARLESTGMVRREALRGYKVAPGPTAEDVRDLLATRQVLEPAMTALASGHADASFVSELRRINAEIERSRQGGETFAGYGPYWKADEMFHRRLAEKSGNEYLLRAYGSVEGHIQRFRLLVHNDEVSGEHTVREHEAIVSALAAKDANAARHAMIIHLECIGSRSAGLSVFGDPVSDIQE